MDEVVVDLLLAGYVALRPAGLALPCYASGPQSNAWYCAVCSIDGDHEGVITAFEPFEASDIVKLPEAARRAVSVGDPWHDVLLWSGDVHVGTPTIIVGQLGDAAAQLAIRAPLTLLDLAMASAGLDRAALTQSAYAHLESQWGSTDADRWQSDIFVRQHLMVEARRLLVPTDGMAAAALIRGLEVQRSGHDLIIDVPDDLRALLAARGLAEAFGERIAGFAKDTGIVLAKPADLSDAPVPLAAAIDPDIKELSDVENTLADPAPGGRTLIIASGLRARQLVRHFGSPAWLPDWDEDDTVAGIAPHRLGQRLGDQPDAESSEKPVIAHASAHFAAFDIIDDRKALPLLDGYATVIWVADDEALARDGGRNIAAELEAAVVPGRLPLCIIAPTLPAQRPPAILADRSLPHDLPPFGTLLDTTVVRSPFWAGNPKRSIDRRVADLICGAALLVAEGSPLRGWLEEDRPRYEPLLLSIASGLRTDRSRIGLASEISSAGISMSDERDGEYFAWSELPIGGDRTRTLRGEALVRRHDPDFSGLAAEIARRNGHDDRQAPLPGVIGDVPSSISECLTFPHLAATTKRDGKRGEATCVLTAEAPDLRTLRSAAMTGWRVVRYSDDDVLRSFSDGPWRGPPPDLPSDIAMPQLNRLGRNRGLAVRGVDPRDVIRMPADIYDTWQSRFGPSDLSKSVRWYRSSVNRYREPPSAAGVAAIPVIDFREAEDMGDEAALFLRQIEELKIAPMGVLSKRSADLRASWVAPADGSLRYMIEDGRLPVRSGPVDPEEVAAQKFFTIDGDASVPLLFSSRLFQVWARATLSRSPSWSSRFSITRTFETFPIPDQFLIMVDDDGGRASLRLNPSSGSLQTLLDGVELDRLLADDMAQPRRRSRSGGNDLREFREEADEALLKMIGLSPDAGDLDLLERLVEMNRSAGL